MSLARCDLVSLLLSHLPVAYQHVVAAVCDQHVQYLADDITMQMCVACDVTLDCMICGIFLCA